MVLQSYIQFIISIMVYSRLKKELRSYTFNPLGIKQKAIKQLHHAPLINSIQKVTHNSDKIDLELNSAILRLIRYVKYARTVTRLLKPTYTRASTMNWTDEISKTFGKGITSKRFENLYSATENGIKLIEIMDEDIVDQKNQASVPPIIMDLSNMTRRLRLTFQQINNMCQKLNLAGICTIAVGGKQHVGQVEARVNIMVPESQHDDLLMIQISILTGGIVFTNDKMSEFRDSISLCKTHKTIMVRKDSRCREGKRTNTICDYIQVTGHNMTVSDKITLSYGTDAARLNIIKYALENHAQRPPREEQFNYKKKISMLLTSHNRVANMIPTSFLIHPAEGANLMGAGVVQLNGPVWYIDTHFPMTYNGIDRLAKLSYINNFIDVDERRLSQLKTFGEIATVNGQLVYDDENGKSTPITGFNMTTPILIGGLLKVVARTACKIRFDSTCDGSKYDLLTSSLGQLSNDVFFVVTKKLVDNNKIILVVSDRCVLLNTKGETMDTIIGMLVDAVIKSGDEHIQYLTKVPLTKYWNDRLNMSDKTDYITIAKQDRVKDSFWTNVRMDTGYIDYETSSALINPVNALFKPSTASKLTVAATIGLNYQDNEDTEGNLVFTQLPRDNQRKELPRSATDNMINVLHRNRNDKVNVYIRSIGNKIDVKTKDVSANTAKNWVDGLSRATLAMSMNMLIDITKLFTSVLQGTNDFVFPSLTRGYTIEGCVECDANLNYTLRWLFPFALHEMILTTEKDLLHVVSLITISPQVGTTMANLLLGKNTLLTNVYDDMLGGDLETEAFMALMPLLDDGSVSYDEMPMLMSLYYSVMPGIMVLQQDISSILPHLIATCVCDSSRMANITSHESLKNIKMTSDAIQLINSKLGMTTRYPTVSAIKPKGITYFQGTIGHNELHKTLLYISSLEPEETRRQALTILHMSIPGAAPSAELSRHLKLCFNLTCHPRDTVTFLPIAITRIKYHKGPCKMPKSLRTKVPKNVDMLKVSATKLVVNTNSNTGEIIIDTTSIQGNVTETNKSRTNRITNSLPVFGKCDLIYIKTWGYKERLDGIRESMTNLPVKIESMTTVNMERKNYSMFSSQLKEAIESSTKPIVIISDDNAGPALKNKVEDIIIEGNNNHPIHIPDVLFHKLFSGKIQAKMTNVEIQKEPVIEECKPAEQPVHKISKYFLILSFIGIFIITTSVLLLAKTISVVAVMIGAVISSAIVSLFGNVCEKFLSKYV